MSTIEVHVPDIGDFDSVEIIEVLVAVGDKVAEEDSLITVESDKASMEIPSPAAGTITSIKVAVGDSIAQGTLIVMMDTAGSSESAPAAEPVKEQAPVAEEAAKEPAPAAASFAGDVDVSAEVVVLGSGPGGYTAAFRAADLGKKVILIEKEEVLGGVCLNVGCIPSKALLHVAEVVSEANEFEELGIKFNKPKIDTDKLRAHKDGVIGKLTTGLKGMAKQRKVTTVHGLVNLPQLIP